MSFENNLPGQHDLKRDHRHISNLPTITSMENSTASFYYAWEYYYDYVDPVVVDESKLKYNKYSIVILFWIFLAAFVGFLFLFLNIMSRSSNPSRNHRSKAKGGGISTA